MGVILKLKVNKYREDNPRSNIVAFLRWGVRFPYFVNNYSDFKEADTVVNRYLDVLYIGNINQVNGVLTAVKSERYNLERFLNGFKSLMEEKKEVIQGTIHKIKSDKDMMNVLKVSYLHHDLFLGHLLRYSLLCATYGLDYRIGLLHDVGKLALPRKVLEKKGVLSRKDKEIIMQHPELGHSIALESGLAKPGSDVLEVIRSHHLRLEGGYGDGDLSAVVKRAILGDIFDALVFKRAYKESWDFERAFAYIHIASTKGERREETKRGFESNGLKNIINENDVKDLVLVDEGRAMNFLSFVGKYWNEGRTLDAVLHNAV